MTNSDKIKETTAIILLERERMEQDISQHISKLVDEFKNNMGIPIKGVSISFMPVLEMGHRRPVYVLIGVDVDLDIGV